MRGIRPVCEIKYTRARRRTGFPSYFTASVSFLFHEDEHDTHLTSTVPTVFWLHPQLFVPVDQAVGIAGLLTVTAFQLGQPGLGIVQLRMAKESPESHNSIKRKIVQAG